MEEKVESEISYSSESSSSSSSSNSSSASSEFDEEVTEPVRILGQTLELPQELCENYAIFKEFFSMTTWDSLEDKHKEYLKELLPTFPDNDEEEKETTIKMLFNFEPLHFKSPMNQFFTNLRQGNYRPDIARMRKFLTKAKAKQRRHKKKSYYAKMLPEVLISRERLLATAKAAPPGPLPFLPTMGPKPSNKNNYKPLYVRARQKYFEELSAIWSEVGGEESEDENYPEGPPENIFKKRKTMHFGQSGDANVSGTLGMADSSHPASLDCLKDVLATHRARRQYRENHPELNTTGISLDDIKQRVALLNGAKKLMFGSQKSETPAQRLKKGAKKDTSKQKQDGKTLLKKIKEEQDSIENKPLLPNIKIKCEKEDSDSEHSSFLDTGASPIHNKKLMDVDIKQEVSEISSNYHENDVENMIKQEPLDPMIAIQNSSRICQPVPIKLEDLDGIDMMALPVELADDSGEVLPVDTSTETEENQLDTDETLTEITHANFLSLVRALFPARAAHRASKQQLHARCAAVMRSPIAPLNTWYHLSDDWCGELNSALDFLAGERGPHPDDYVPYLQYMSDTKMYQWIGAGRDCDAILGRLCERWLRAVSPPPPATEAPPPRYPTSWIVRQPTTAEITDFRTQERKRYAAASKPFTYIQYGYRSAVGPATGLRAGAGAAGGSGAALLTQQRPRAAAFLALLRDALARLPNGEGTRRDIVTLLKMSQWITPNSEQALSIAVANALERLVSVKRDPIVKYDQRTALWTYLHRHKSEEDWVKSATSRGRVNKANASAHQVNSAQTSMEVDGQNLEDIHDNASDSDVDVDDTGAPTSAQHLSSAQLLMQATQATHPKPTTANKQKGKLVPAMPKVKTITPKQNAKMPSLVQTKQTPKQSNAPPKSNQTNATPKQPNQANPSSKQSNITPKASPKQTPQKQLSQTNQKQSSQTNPKQSAQLNQKASTQTNQKQLAQTNPKPTSLLTPAKSMPNLTKQNTAKQAASQKQTVKQSAQSPKLKQIVVQTVKQNAPLTKQNSEPTLQVPSTMPSIVVTPQRSPLMKQKSLKIETSQAPVTLHIPVQQSSSPTVIQPNFNVVSLHQNTLNQSAKMTQVTRSLLIRPPTIQTASSAPTITVCTPATQITQSARRGIVRVLSPAAPSTGKSLISPRALMQQSTPPTSKKRASVPGTTSVMTVAQSTTNTTNVVSSIPTAVSSSVTTRTVQLAGGRTVQLAANQTVHLPGGQAVQLSSGHTLQLSSLQLPTHSVRLPSGQTVQLATSQTMQAVRAVSTSQVRNPSPRMQTTTSSIKPNQSVQIPVSTVQLAGQTVQIAGQTVQLTGQSMQLTGHTVKLPSGQSVQVASQSVLPSQSVQLPSGQTVQLSSGNMQAVQLGQNVQLGGQTVQIPSGQNVQLGGQTVQIGGQTVQLAGGQTVQLPSGQTLQLSSGQTVQLSSGQTLQLASGQTLQLANQQTPKSIGQVVRTQPSGEKNSQPIVAKLLTNAQTQMISLEGMMGGGAGRARGIRVLAPNTRLARPLLLTSAKPLHNIILQQSDGTAIRVTSTGGTATSQTIVLSNLGNNSIGAQTVTTSSTTTPVLKLQQVNPIHQVKLPQGIKIQQAATSASGTTPTGVRSVLMDGQQLKLVSGRHVLARLLKPTHPPP
ncbi:nuclear factor related to kappa-B-binding protein isoform X2 [Pararge aegeria]|uniref:Jg16797 protein n=1 Tax=Pararge aegeria aegeria TaxID=348720 RepID=A0A8S4S344_9NEOP|nr:nuclear factor related to kappa-B-binding protein isoform X2 [Pararge aegeria]CAH2243955.1 jg16797 [Pararge aegeria aegeria]